MAQPLRADILEQLADSDVLQECLNAACGSNSTRRVVAGFAVEGRMAYAATGATHIGADAGRESVLPGCCAKLFTAALARSALEEELLALDSEIADLLSNEALRGIRVRHLLEHTHGLNTESLQAAPRSSSGYIDAAALCQRATASRPLARPGQIYTYSVAGALLTAAILESLYGAPYEQLLYTRLLRPLGSLSFPAGVCPAGTGSFALPVQDFMTFLCFESRRADQLRAARGEASSVKLPGFSTQVLAVTLGWNHYAGGWLGHNSTVPTRLALARMHPERQLAMFIASQDAAPGIIAARMFGHLLPELVRFRMPVPRRVVSTGVTDLMPYVGSWSDERQRIEIVLSEEYQLELHLYWAHQKFEEIGPTFVARLIPATDHVFIVRGDLPGFPSFVQFIQPGRRGFELLWNGSSVWRQVDTSQGED